MPVRNRSSHVADVDVVKLIVVKGPLLVNVINLELAVRGNKVGLDWRQVDADGACRWIQVGEFTAMLVLGMVLCKWEGITTHIAQMPVPHPMSTTLWFPC